jgi:hypothetical protein
MAETNVTQLRDNKSAPEDLGPLPTKNRRARRVRLTLLVAVPALAC